MNELFYILKTKFFLALYTAPLWVSFGMTLGLLDFGMNLGQIRTFLVKCEILGQIWHFWINVEFFVKCGSFG